MPVVKKVLNSSIILIEGEGSQDSIVMSKGIGYGRKAGETVELQEDSRYFIPVSNVDRKHLLELLDAIPAVYLEVTRDVVTYAEKLLKTSLNEHIYLALTDHLHFAVKRFKEDMVVRNKMSWELKTFYPKEYEVGRYALETVRQKIGVELPAVETANIAFHILNAQKDAKTDYDVMQAARLIGNVVSLVTYLIKNQPDKESIHYSRFITHMQFFAERILGNCMLESEDDFLYSQISLGYPQAVSYAEKIRTYILKEYNKTITNEEVAFLAVHIQRLVLRA